MEYRTKDESSQINKMTKKTVGKGRMCMCDQTLKPHYTIITNINKHSPYYCCHCREPLTADCVDKVLHTPNTSQNRSQQLRDTRNLHFTTKRATDKVLDSP